MVLLRERGRSSILLESECDKREDKGGEKTERRGEEVEGKRGRCVGMSKTLLSS